MYNRSCNSYNLKKITIQSSEYPKLRSLWSDVFGDEPAYVDSFYKHWGKDIWGCVLSDDGGVRSALTCFRMGALGGREVWISYAICTDPSARGLGYGSIITEYARDIVVSEGGVSMLCPAEASLVGFYEKLGYHPCGYTMTAEKISRFGELIQTDDASKDFERISADEYFNLREEKLAGISHVKLGQKAKEWIKLEYDDSFFISRQADNSEPSIFIPNVEILPECASSADTVQAMIASSEQYCKKTYLGFAFD